MELFRLGWNYITNSQIRSQYKVKLKDKFFPMSDKEYIEAYFKASLGYPIDLDNPRTLCEKLNWLKLYNRRPEYTSMVDKYEVKSFVAEQVGEQYVTKLIGVWDRFDDIDFHSLPDRFVLKCTHDGTPLICTDKNKLDLRISKELFEKKLKTDYFRFSREWPYKNVRRRIIAEEYYPSLGNKDSVEYKLTCMNGEVRFITVCTGIAHAEFDLRKNDHFDKAWKRLVPWECMDEMIGLAEKLSAGIPYVRVDFYVIEGQIKFGEMTFFTWGGFMRFEPQEWDLKLGEWLVLPEKYNEI